MIDLYLNILYVMSGPGAQGRDKWEYLDPEGATRGPFPSDAMLNWQSAGYFHEDLPVSQGSSITLRRRVSGYLNLNRFKIPSRLSTDLHTDPSWQTADF